MNANLTNSTNYGSAHALVPSSLAGKCASVMPVATAARAWNTDLSGALYRFQSNVVRSTRSMFGTDTIGTGHKNSIRRSCKPRVANA